MLYRAVQGLNKIDVQRYPASCAWYMGGAQKSVGTFLKGLFFIIFNGVRVGMRSCVHVCLCVCMHVCVCSYIRACTRVSFEYASASAWSIILAGKLWDYRPVCGHFTRDCCSEKRSQKGAPVAPSGTA